MKATTTTTRIRTRSHRSERRRKRKFQKKDKQKENDLTRCVRRREFFLKMRSLCKVVKELLEREEEVVGRLLEAKNDNGNSGGLTISADLYDACIEDLLRG